MLWPVHVQKVRHTFKYLTCGVASFKISQRQFSCQCAGCPNVIPTHRISIATGKMIVLKIKFRKVLASEVQRPDDIADSIFRWSVKPLRATLRLSRIQGCVRNRTNSRIGPGCHRMRTNKRGKVFASTVSSSSLPADSDLRLLVCNITDG